MNDLIKILETHPFETEDGDKIYLLQTIKNLFNVEKINKDTWVATIGGGEEIFLQFCFFYFNYSSCGASEEIGVTLLFCGIGNDYLGELRHTYFNEYYFYIDSKSMIDCFSWLSLKFKD